MSRVQWKPLILLLVFGVIVAFYAGCLVAHAEPPSESIDPEVVATLVAAMKQAGVDGDAGYTNALGTPLAALIIAGTMLLSGRPITIGAFKKEETQQHATQSAVILGQLAANTEQLLKEIRHDLPNKLIAPLNEVTNGNEEKLGQVLNELGAIKVRLESLERITLHQDRQGRTRGGGG